MKRILNNFFLIFDNIYAIFTTKIFVVKPVSCLKLI